MRAQAEGQRQGPVLPHDKYKSERWTLHLALTLGEDAVDEAEAEAAAAHVYLGDHQVQRLAACTFLACPWHRLQAPDVAGGSTGGCATRPATCRTLAARLASREPVPVHGMLRRGTGQDSCLQHLPCPAACGQPAPAHCLLPGQAASKRLMGSHRVLCWHKYELSVDREACLRAAGLLQGPGRDVQEPAALGEDAHQAGHLLPAAGPQPRPLQRPAQAAQAVRACRARRAGPAPCACQRP